MKFAPLALVLGMASPAFASTSFLVDFEKAWNFGEAVDSFYAGQGVVFSNVLGFSNDALSTGFANAPSPLGVAFVQLDGVVNTTAFMNVAAGTDNLSFFYSATDNAPAAIKVYDGLNGTGSLLATIDLPANSTAFDNWTQISVSFSAEAKSFNLSGANGVVAFDNISAVPEPTSLAMLLAGGALVAARRRRSA